MCAVLSISLRTYYKYRNSEDKDYYDYLMIKEIFEDSKCTYGSRDNVNLKITRNVTEKTTKNGK
ncbi:MAG: hypothetical protein E7187_06545 [Erysipelotrichaceae bacterium]|nr:hypothetical protein [Erysipelotrichaceae bacterium]